VPEAIGVVASWPQSDSGGNGNGAKAKNGKPKAKKATA
jgi:hypothetical protein